MHIIKIFPACWFFFPHYMCILFYNIIDWLYVNYYIAYLFLSPAKITKQKKKTTDRFNTDTSLASQFGTLKVKGSFETSPSPNKKEPLFNSKVAVDYNLPLLENKDLRKNKLNLNAKIQDKSSARQKKYDFSMWVVLCFVVIVVTFNSFFFSIREFRNRGWSGDSYHFF